MNLLRNIHIYYIVWWCNWDMAFYIISILYIKMNTTERVKWSYWNSYGCLAKKTQTQQMQWNTWRLEYIDASLIKSVAVWTNDDCLRNMPLLLFMSPLMPHKPVISSQVEALHAAVVKASHNNVKLSDFWTHDVCSSKFWINCLLSNLSIILFETA